MEVLGIDIGGSGIKASVVDTETGTLLGERFRIPTPADTSPPKIMSRIHDIRTHFQWEGPIGVAIPESVRYGVVQQANNLDGSWVDVNAQELFEQTTDCPVAVLNDADAAGVAEMKFGAGENQKGVVILLTVGTGIGSALFMEKKLVPNTELGHLLVGNNQAGDYASERTRINEGLKRREWAKRLEEVLQFYERIFYPDLFIISGGMSDQADKTLPHVDIRTPLVPAAFLNNAGIAGAAIVAAEMISETGR